MLKKGSQKEHVVKCRDASPPCDSSASFIPGRRRRVVQNSHFCLLKSPAETEAGRQQVLFELFRVKGKQPLWVWRLTPGIMMEQESPELVLLWQLLQILQASSGNFKGYASDSCL